MSNVGPAGYPDFGRYVQQAASLILRDNNVAFPIDVVFGPIYVGTLAALSIRFAVDSAPVAAQVNITFYDDQAATKQTGVRIIHCNGVNNAVAVVAVLGNWCRFDFISDTHPANMKRWTTIQGFTWRPDSSDLMPWGKLISHRFIFAAGPATQDFELTDTCNARATVSCNSNAGNAAIEVQQYDSGATLWVPMLVIQNLAGTFIAQTEGFLECAPTRFHVTNGAAGASTVTIGLVFGS